MKSSFSHLKKIRFLLFLIVGLFLIEDVLFGYNNFQNSTAILGLKLNGYSLSNLSRPQIEEVIKTETSKTMRPLMLVYQDKHFEVKPEEIGAKINPQQLTNSIIQEGRTGSFLRKVIDQNESLLGVKSEKIHGEISQSLLNVKIIEIQNAIDQDATSPMPDFQGDLNRTIPAKYGLKVNTDKLMLLIADNIFNPSQNTITIPTYKTFSNHNESELSPIRSSAAELTKQPISITSGGLEFSLSVADINSILTIVERPSPADPKKTVLELRLDDKKLNQKLGDFASKVEALTHAEFDDHDARVAIYSQFYSKRRFLAAIPTGRALETKRVLGVENTPGAKTVYLTFDDGPNSIYHPMILDILKAYNVKATFFLVGLNTQRDLEIAKRTVSEGHKIGNHSLTHSFLPNLSNSSILKEIQDTDEILKPINSNQDITLFRPPYGGVNLSVKQVAEKANLKLTLWGVDPKDWSEPSTDELVRRVVSATNNGADILLHSNHLATVKALPKIIETLKGQGYSFDVIN